MTPDSNNFQVTFDYEFLEDFREKKTQGVHVRSTIVRRQLFQQENNWSSRDPLTERDDGFFQSVIQRAVNAPDPNVENNWGPEGFNKNNHPLNIMVRMK